MERSIVKHSLSIAGHRTSVSLETPFWEALHDIAAAAGYPLPALIRHIDASRGAQNLSSAIRVFVLEYLRGKISLPAESGSAAEG